jgi:hypothetical protein
MAKSVLMLGPRLVNRQRGTECPRGTARACGRRGKAAAAALPPPPYPFPYRPPYCMPYCMPVAPRVWARRTERAGAAGGAEAGLKNSAASLLRKNAGRRDISRARPARGRAAAVIPRRRLSLSRWGSEPASAERGGGTAGAHQAPSE